MRSGAGMVVKEARIVTPRTAASVGFLNLVRNAGKNDGKLLHFAGAKSLISYAA